MTVENGNLLSPNRTDNKLLAIWGIVVLAGIGVVVSGLGFWYRETILNGYHHAEEYVLSGLSLGLIPVVLWLAAFISASLIKRELFYKINLWIASIFGLVGILGVMSFFDIYFGSLSWATLGGKVSLGGKVGEVIAGPEDILGVIRVAAILIVALVVAMPTTVLFVARYLGRLLVFGYVILVLGVRKTGLFVRNINQGNPDDKNLGRQTSSGGLSSAELSELLKPESIDGDVTTQFNDETDLTDKKGPSGEQPAQEYLPDIHNSTVQSGSPEVHEAIINDTSTDVKPTEKTKLNRFWKTAFESGTPNKQDENYQNLDRTNEESNQQPSTNGPILDSSAAVWSRPKMELLHDLPEGGITQKEMDETAGVIEQTLGDYGVEVEIGETRPGPTVTMYGLVPGWIRRQKQIKATDDQGNPKLDDSGKAITSRVEMKTRVKVDAIMSREKDLALALRTHSIRIETPAMGKSLVGIEVPNPNPSLVTLRGVMESPEYQRLRARAKLPIALGRGSGGEAIAIDLSKMPHLLVAGATGSGKSVCINTIISGLIMEKTPAEIRLLLIDPKRVELTPYNGIPHLLTPVVVETDQVVGFLKGMIHEMLGRYRRMEEVGVRNIDSYNRKMSDRMPYLVIAVDELADLMMSASFDVEQSLCRLAQLGRATGIHLIVATQRPSVDVVTGLIKANFPSRISFGVTSQIDSRTILDTVGAEKLLGRGDMLYQAVDASRPERVQGVFISDTEIDDLVKFWETTPWAPLASVALHTTGDGDEENSSANPGLADGKDEMLDKAIELAHQSKKLSTSLLQRRLRIGYPRAARLMDQLEDEGVVGPSDGSKSRDVIISAM